jgi:hypothetical protein
MTPQARMEMNTPVAANAASRAGVGYSQLPDSREAGAEAARMAVAGLAGARADLVMPFATSKYDPAPLLDGVQSVVGSDVKLVGGSAFGGMTNDWLGYDGFQVVVAAIASPNMRVDLFTESGLDSRGELAVGQAIGRRISAGSYLGESNILLMYDSVKKAGVELNVATTILEGVASTLGSWPDCVAGIGLIGDLAFRPTFQADGSRVLQQSAIAAVFSGGVRMDTTIMHGCTPSGRYHTVTKTDGTVVLEIDGRPALDFLGDLVPDRNWEEYPLFITLGVNNGDKFGEFHEEHYANHLCMAIDRDRGGLVMFEPNLTAGSEVQLMRRSIDLDYVGVRTRELFDRVADRHPFFALYIDCAGRASAVCNSDGEEAVAVQRVLTERGVPLLGLYAGVEIAKVAGSVQALDWTGVLCLFSE